MPELVATRGWRRRVPSNGSWVLVSWRGAQALPVGTGNLQGWICAGALAAGLALGVSRLALTESVAVREDSPLWMELPPPAPEPEQPVPPPPAPVPDQVAAAQAATVPLAATPDAPANPDPAFGLDDAEATGGLAVAAGSTLLRDPDPVVRAPEPPSGPVLLASVPASVRPVVPVYPPRAEEMGWEAKVVAVVATDTAGHVVEVRIERSGGRDFDASVRRAVLSTRFQVPRRADGSGQAVAFRLPYDFRLE
jgi:protein TonB